MSTLFESLLADYHEQDEVVTLNVQHLALKHVLEYCELFEFNPQPQMFRENLRKTPSATTFEELQATTREIMFWQDKSLEEMVTIANTANYLDMPSLIDASCCAIALQLRITSRDDPQQVSKQEDKTLKTEFKHVYN